MNWRIGLAVLCGWATTACVTNGELVELCELQNEKWDECGLETSTPEECSALGSLEPSLIEQAELVCLYRCQINASCREIAALSCVASGDAETDIQVCFRGCESISAGRFATDLPQPCVGGQSGWGGAID